MAVRRTVRALAGLAVLVVASAPVPAFSEGDDRPAGPPATFAAEGFATPSYHVMEIPKVEEGGEGFTWSYLNQQPESWGRALMFWPGPTAEATFATSLPQQGPFIGHHWKSPGAWASYPTGGEARGLADFGEPAIPLGTTVDTPGGTMQLLSFSGRAGAAEGIAETAFGSFRSSVAPVRIGFARAFSSATREEAAAVSSGWAVVRDVQIGDVSVDEIRSDASVRATTAGETGTWKLTISGVTVGGQRLEWTNHGVSFAPGSEAPLQQLNTELAKGAEGFRSEFQVVPGRVWRDDAGTHVQSGFLQMGTRPVILENNPGQKMGYALSVVSARALYRQAEAGVGLDDDLPPPAPDVPGPAQASTAAGSDAGPGSAGPTGLAGSTRLAAENGAPAVATGPEPSVLLAPARDADGLGSGVGGGGDGGAGGGLATEPSLGTAAGGAGEMAVGAPGFSSGYPAVQAAPAVATGLGQQAAESLRGGITLVALLGAAAAVALLRAARRQLELIGTSRGGG